MSACFVADRARDQSSCALSKERLDRLQDDHNRRCAIDATKIRAELGWKARMTFAEGLHQTWIGN
jgi:dTDP-D-glucose 4,6-dehydratase